MKVLFSGGEFEATFDPNVYPNDVPVTIRKVRSEKEHQVLWQPQRKYVHPQATHFTGLFREALQHALERSLTVTSEPTSDTKFIILRGIEERNRFYSLWKNDGHDYTKLSEAAGEAAGTVAYDILGYAQTDDAAQIFLFGKSYVEKCEEIRGQNAK